ncbi:hypothetical protein FZEAL_5857 [Fusarium zealandicum]|uniref:Uncharacterized protein n=1 Tax=Fusarium zealandicum TaxID=1053134 RepID=A0A8H4XJE0_9HYPO|nr:hypothetical protein FZEAL_5857 [Fusarium zealandicum]
MLLPEAAHQESAMAASLPTLSPTPCQPASGLATRSISQPPPSPPSSTGSKTSPLLSLPSLQEQLWKQDYTSIALASRHRPDHRRRSRRHRDIAMGLDRPANHRRRRWLKERMGKRAGKIQRLLS